MSDKKDILEKLANREISQEEADRMLKELNEPILDELPPPPAPPKNNGGKGCLIALIVGAALIFIFLVLGALSFFVVVRERKKEELHLRAMHMRENVMMEKKIAEEKYRIAIEEHKKREQEEAEKNRK